MKPTDEQLIHSQYFSHQRKIMFMGTERIIPSDSTVKVYIQRPTSQPTDKPEWDGVNWAWPPVGWHGECTWGQKQNWFECVVLPKRKIALYKYNEWSFMDCLPSDDHDFRPLKTQAEREREELMIILSETWLSDKGQVADALLAWIKERNQ